MDDDDTAIINDDGYRSSDDRGESWLAEQARLVLLEEGN